MTDICVLRDITARYGDVTVIDRLNLAIPEGAFVTLLGPSGCGKSTTLRMIGGFETPAAGQVLLAGKDVTHVAPNHRDTNLVFQDYALFPHMTVAENIAFGLKRKGAPRDVIRQRVDELMQLVRLPDMAQRLPAMLSGGQRQRVALARALARDPALLLLDEPLGALDAKLREEMQHELKSLQRATGKAFVFVTHDQEEALTMSDVVVVMNKGRIEQQGAPVELYRDPQSRFVASFIGKSNFFEGRLQEASAGIGRVEVAGGTLSARLGSAPLKAGDAVVVAVRPEKVALATERPQGNAIEARLQSLSYKGAKSTALFADAFGRRIEMDFNPEERRIEAGDSSVWLGWQDADGIVLAA
ncbi:ABC transporter ATP-binding protein [Xinfangfangia sp. CPCC 101601]|uniref:ABC transporter ATP-binding protein n=1 Tax=Pseudogemmobacter lacusdianii TaxID=3069608 RepID=A0ABU0VTQ9_9RHOB|nr:ABC transporter ATP-binding protein [Xinfangfangia sp. CPCC 101601]MDQ2065117.1 ABC transporter ATP-binding protein [Xinfangfangia sp. CPCC 101601]